MGHGRDEQGAASVLVKRGLAGLLLVAVALAAEFGLSTIIPDTAYRQLCMLAMINVVVALSLNIINGMAGQFSIGHAGFVGVGAYTGAIVSSHIHQSLGARDFAFASSFMVVPPSIVAGALVAGAFGLIVGLPSLRLKGDYLAIVTLGFAEIFRLLIATSSPGSTGIRGEIAKLGGPQGYAGPTDGGIAQYAGPFWVVGAMILSILIAWRLKFSGWGRALQSLREDEIAASAVGVDPTNYKVTSFVMSAMGAGVAGALWAGMRDGNPTVQPEQFNFAFSFDAITMVILGGSGSVSGAVLGGIFVTVTVKMIEQLQRLDVVEAFKSAHPEFDLNALRMVVYAIVLILLMMSRPAGVFGENEIGRWFRRKRAEV
ncbi:MAG: branched-chain amino acid ABC transporter permease [Myxococcales bacterium]|nr:branched-chain amino acid ABC transporter permease [Myxococcales bacterium]